MASTGISTSRSAVSATTSQAIGQSSTSEAHLHLSSAHDLGLSFLSYDFLASHSEQIDNSEAFVPIATFASTREGTQEAPSASSRQLDNAVQGQALSESNDAQAALDALLAEFAAAPPTATIESTSDFTFEYAVHDPLEDVQKSPAATHNLLFGFDIDTLLGTGQYTPMANLSAFGLEQGIAV